jgi:arylsulfatase A-like enzyme
MGKVSRREFIGAASAFAGAASASGQADRMAATRPNILFIMADDLGWGDLSCYGRPDYKTPNIDRLASGGLRLTNAYSAAPSCTPTRVGFHSGRYPARLRIGLEEPLVARKVLGDRIKELGIPHDHPTVSSLIKGAGYDTCLLGKWHVGYLPTFSPLKYGFDEFFGMTSGAGDHFGHIDPAGDPDLFEGEASVEETGYLTDLLTERAVQYVKRPRKAPFYLSLHYTAPHWPWQGPRDAATAKTFKPGPVGFSAGGSAKTYAEMMKSLDHSIGTVLSALRDKGLDRNTLVIFTSDNGGERFSYNWPFTGQKFDLREGGIRVPSIVRWPGRIKPGSVADEPVVTMDWSATMIASAGAKPDSRFPLDGQDLTSLLTGRSAPNERSIHWRTKRQGAIRRGRWKYLREGSTEFLFDLSVDEREQADFKDLNRSILEELRAAFARWDSGMLRYPDPAD